MVNVLIYHVVIYYFIKLVLDINKQISFILNKLFILYFVFKVNYGNNALEIGIIKILKIKFKIKMKQL